MTNTTSERDSYKFYGDKRHNISVVLTIVGQFWLNFARTMRYVSVPVLTLPMDVIVGSKLQGSITGTVYGAPSLVSGKMNSALVLNGIDQKVVFGKYLGKCFHLPDMCDHESTFAYWLKWKPTTRGVIFDSGGYYLSSRGYFHGIQQNGKMTVYIKDATHYFDLNTPVGYIPQDQWVYVVQTWSTGSSTKIYLDGCMFSNVGTKATRTTALTRDVNFVIGATSAGANLDWANIKLDNFLSWDEELSNEEVWRLYIQGGWV